MIYQHCQHQCTENKTKFNFGHKYLVVILQFTHLCAFHFMDLQLCQEFDLSPLHNCAHNIGLGFCKCSPSNKSTCFVQNFTCHIPFYQLLNIYLQQNKNMIGCWWEGSIFSVMQPVSGWYCGPTYIINKKKKKRRHYFRINHFVLVKYWNKLIRYRIHKLYIVNGNIFLFAVLCIRMVQLKAM